jgi:hypothetical protein
MKYIFVFTRNCKTGFLLADSDSLESARITMIREWLAHLAEKKNLPPFLQPTKISKEMAEFTGWDPSSLCSRVDISKFICEYIRKKNLQDPEDSRVVRVGLDLPLKKFLQVEDGKSINYYSLQGYLQKHFDHIPTPMYVFGTCLRDDEEPVINDGRKYPSMLKALEEGFIEEVQQKVVQMWN